MTNIMLIKVVISKYVYQNNSNLKPKKKPNKNRKRILRALEQITFRL